jgi:hypothetical protein
MKTYIIYTALALLAGATLGASYYRYISWSSTEITILYDITDATEILWDTTDVPAYLTTHTSGYGETTLHFGTISDFRESDVRTIHIPAVFPLTVNPYKRAQELKVMQIQMLTAIKGLVNSHKGRNQSAIYEPIASALNRLSQSKAHTRILIVYSDLQEHSTLFNAYEQTNQTLLAKHPDKVQAAFEQRVPLAPLQGISVVRLFQSKNPEEEASYLTMANFLTGFLGNKGAVVSHGRTLNP